MLSCDHPCTLCTFMQPICCFFLHAFDVQVGQVGMGRVMVPKEMRSGQVGSVRVMLYHEGTQGNMLKWVESGRVM